MIKILDCNYALRRNLIDQVSGHAGTAEVPLAFGANGVYRDLGDDVPATEVQALIDFYYAAGGSSWTNNTNWLTDTTVGNWYGVTVSGGHVTEINLGGNNLDNVLTEAQSLAFLNALPSLTELRLYSNSSFGLTFSISDNSTLTYLHVGNTSSNITGSIADNSTLTHLHVGNTSSNITGSIADNSTLTHLYVYNTSSNITGSIADNSTLTYLHVGNTSSNITGSIADNSTLTYMHVGSTSSNITGSIADNSTLTYLYVYSTSSNITGGSTTLTSYAYKEIQLQDTSMSETNVDGVLEDIYRIRDNITDATPELNIAGNNAAPSGTYQDGDPPTTGKEYQYEIVNDPESEGFNTWTVTANA